MSDNAILDCPDYDSVQFTLERRHFRKAIQRLGACAFSPFEQLYTRYDGDNGFSDPVYEAEPRLR